MPSAAWRPIRTIGWIARALRGEVEDALEEAAGVAGPRRALADSGMPSGTSTMPSAVSSPARGSSRAAPSRISSSAVAGLATGMRIRAGQRRPAASRRRPGRFGGVDGGPPALDEVRLEQLELAGLALDAILGLLGRRCRGSR